MSLIRKALALLFLCPLVVVPCAQAQHGKIILPTSASRGHGVHPENEPPLGYVSTYVLDVGFPYNTAPTSLVDCTLVGNPSYPQVKSDGTNCYVQSDSGGNFNLTGTYYQNCVTDNDVVYFESTASNVVPTPPLPSSNPYLALLAVPPSEWNCGYLYENSSSISVYLTELTTVAAAFATGSYANLTATQPDGISYGTTALITNDQKLSNYYALLNAFDTANSLVPISTGIYGGTNTTVEEQLNTIADVLDTCINSSNPSTDCGNLVTDTTAYYEDYFTFTPVNTWEMAQSMAQDPTNNVSEIYGLIGSSSTTPPWTPYLSSAPGSGMWAITQSSTTPVIDYPLTESVVGTHPFITINGEYLADESTSPYTYPTVIFCGQVAALGSLESITPSSVTVPVPLDAGYCPIQVYLEGDFSNIGEYPLEP